MQQRFRFNPLNSIVFVSCKELKGELNHTMCEIKPKACGREISVNNNRNSRRSVGWRMSEMSTYYCCIKSKWLNFRRFLRTFLGFFSPLQASKFLRKKKDSHLQIFLHNSMDFKPSKSATTCSPNPSVGCIRKAIQCKHSLTKSVCRPPTWSCKHHPSWDGIMTEQRNVNLNHWHIETTYKLKTAKASLLPNICPRRKLLSLLTAVQPHRKSTSTNATHCPQHWTQHAVSHHHIPQ